MAVSLDKSTRPGWGWAFGIGIPLFMLANAAEDGGNGAASTTITLLALTGMWICVGKGRTAQTVRARLSSQRTVRGPAQQSKPAPGNAAAARELASKLRGGGAMERVSPSFRLHQGEDQYATFDGVTLHEWFGVDVPYTTIHNSAFHPVGWFIHATVHRAINSRNRARAEAQAAPTWRAVATGRVHVTSARLVLDDGVQLLSWWFASIVQAEANDDTLVLRFEDDPAILLQLDDAYVLQVALHHLAWNQVVDLPAPRFGAS